MNTIKNTSVSKLSPITFHGFRNYRIILIILFLLSGTYDSSLISHLSKIKISDSNLISTSAEKLEYNKATNQDNQKLIIAAVDEDISSGGSDHKNKQLFVYSCSKDITNLPYETLNNTDNEPTSDLLISVPNPRSPPDIT